MAARKPLKGVKVLLDPGHGGVEYGATGPGGLKEKDVNLAMALALGSLLEGAGAKVLFTREADTTLALPRRITLISKLSFDCFISIHHNATPDLPRNRTEVYCPWVRTGPSFDLARLVTERVGLALSLPSIHPRPSKYGVLSHSREPAVLVEASYIQDPKEEPRLARSETHQLEAEAVFKAVRDYFAAPPPTIRQARVAGDVLSLTVEGEYEPLFTDVELDGSACQFELTDRGIAVPIPQLPGGRHAFHIRVRNSQGRESPTREVEFHVRRIPAEARFSIFPRSLPPGALVPLLVTATLLDENGQGLENGAEVHLAAGRGQKSQKQDVVVKDGIAHAVFELSPGEVVLSASARGFITEQTLSVEQDSAVSVMSGIIRDGRGEKAGEQARIRFRESGLWSHAPGFFALAERGPLLGKLSSWIRGHRPHIADVNVGPGRAERHDITFRPLQGGALLGKRVAVDLDDARVSPLATDLANILQFHGAEVLVLRGGHSPLTEEERAWRAVAFGSEVFVSLSMGAKKRLLHYHNDEAGGALAESLNWALSLNSIGDFPIEETGRYVIIHPDGARAAVVLSGEERMEDVADALFTGVLNFAIGQG